MKLQYKIMIFMTLILVGILGTVGLLTYNQLEKTIESQMSSSAMDLATTVASMENIKDKLDEKDQTGAIQNIVERFRDNTRFKYIIIIDMNGIKYSYPIENDLYTPYIVGGEADVLTLGASYVQKDKNVLLSAIRAYKPIYNDDEQVGAVIVGLLNNTVYADIKQHDMTFRFIIIAGLLIAIMSSYLLARTIKRSIYGLEPKEISLLLGQFDIVLHSLEYGILAVDKNLDILMCNKCAEDLFEMKEVEVGKNIKDISKAYTKGITRLFGNEESVYNEEIKLQSGKTLLASHCILKGSKQETIGVVSSFQDLSKAKRMAEELIDYEMMTDALRAQNHEFMNKLHTISGLMQLEEYDKACNYIAKISNVTKEFTSILNKKIKNSHLAAILLAKYFKANEAKMVMVLDQDSDLTEMPSQITEDDLCSIVGNLIENAMDELSGSENGKITIKINSDGEGLWLSVIDNGRGIEESIKDNVFDKGVTTKSGNRGIGLNIIKNIIDSAGGFIEVICDKGTEIQIFIPVLEDMEDADD